MSHKKPFYMDINQPFCPTCGRENHFRESPEWLLSLFTGMYGRIIAILINCRRTKQHYTLDELVDIVYADSDHTPKTRTAGILAAITRNKDKLAQAGWIILSHKTTKCGYQLVRLEYDDKAEQGAKYKRK